jgi:hypothetical protein
MEGRLSRIILAVISNVSGMIPIGTTNLRDIQEESLMSNESTADALRRLANLNAERDQLYNREEYAWAHGRVMIELFGGSVPEMMRSDDASRMGLINQIVSKLIRYTSNWNKGGHQDSLDDLSVYSQMLAELDRQCQ